MQNIIPGPRVLNIRLRIFKIKNLFLGGPWPPGRGPPGG